MGLRCNQIHQGDCIEGLAKVPDGTVDLVFADPPFNIGYDYDLYRDDRSTDEYLAWSRRWLGEVVRVLKPSGTFWLAIGDEFAAELKLIVQRELRMHCRSWVIWYYTFGVNCSRKFSRSHAHLFHFVKDHRKFVFHADDPAVRVPSARQLVYADSRANPRGRLPDDTWILRPQDLPGGFAPDQDTWYFPRVAGTFKERAGFHGCQMPEQLLGRIIRVSSSAGDLVVDPFAGSGTTLAVAKKLGRSWLGFELSPDYARQASKRVSDAHPGDGLIGAADPLSSAPTTPGPQQPLPRGEARRALPAEQAPAHVKTSTTSRTRPNRSDKTGAAKALNRSLDDLLVTAYRKSHQGLSLDWILADPELNDRFAAACERLGAPGDRGDWLWRLITLRKSRKGLLSSSKRGPSLSHEELDHIGFASEIALAEIGCQHTASLDEILCRPSLVHEFDEHAQALAPNFATWKYRWAALTIRKYALAAKRNAERHRAILGQYSLSKPAAMAPMASHERYAGVPGVYVLFAYPKKALYVGETLDLRQRLELHKRDWPRPESPESVSVLSLRESNHALRLGCQSLLIGRFKSKYNFSKLAVA